MKRTTELFIYIYIHIYIYIYIYIYIFSSFNIKMLEIAIDNCHKSDLETIIDPNNSEYF